MVDIEDLRYKPIPNGQVPELIEVVNRRYEIGKLWAQACAIHNRYENGAAVKLKQIMNEIKNTVPVPQNKKFHTRDEVRDLAEATEEWETFTREANEAYTYMVDLSNEKTTIDMLFEAVRTVSANQRALSKALG